MTLTLRPLITADEAAFRNAVAEFRAIEPSWDFAFHFEGVTDFTAYVRRLEDWSKGRDLAPRFVPNTFLIALVDGEIVGRISIRHELNDFLVRLGGHVGYGVLPSCRRRGYATAMLRAALPVCKDLGLDRILLTCDDDNVASRRVIEANQGSLENVVSDATLTVPKRRYWIDLTAAPR